MNKIKQLLAGLPRPDVDLRDVVTFGGIASVGYGLGVIYPPAAWIVCGVALFWLGVR